MKTLIDSIYAKIHEEIVSGHLHPGQKLHISQLASHYQVGLSPIREALSRLLATELVTAVSQKGFRVATVSLKDLNDIYTTRAHIEALALQLSIEQGTDEWEAKIIAAHHRLAKFESEHPIRNADDYKEWEIRHHAFNLALIDACGLTHLLRIQYQLYNLTERYRRQWLMAGIKQSHGLPYAKEQKKIMDATLARNAELATKLLRKHYENAIEVIGAHFSKHHLFSHGE